MFLFAMKAWLYALPFLGLALCVSQIWSSPNIATVFGLIAMVVLTVLTPLSDWLADKGWRGLWDVVHSLTPGAHKTALWWNDAAHLVPALAFLLGLTAAYFLAGYWRFSRRDL
jgi:ABC-type transport system involved in multi-copper enzyme maturation permease subunit